MKDDKKNRGNINKHIASFFVQAEKRKLDRKWSKRPRTCDLFQLLVSLYFTYARIFRSSRKKF